MFGYECWVILCINNIRILSIRKISAFYAVFSCILIRIMDHKCGINSLFNVISKIILKHKSYTECLKTTDWMNFYLLSVHLWFAMPSRIWPIDECIYFFTVLGQSNEISTLASSHPYKIYKKNNCLFI